MNCSPEILNEVKDKFFQIIKDKYISKYMNANENLNGNNNLEEEQIDNILKKSDITQRDKFIRNLLVFFDVLMENIEFRFKLSEYPFFHHITVRKIIVGAVKGINKVLFI